MGFEVTLEMILSIREGFNLIGSVVTSSIGFLQKKLIDLFFEII
jgi:hypothetical protein